MSEPTVADVVAAVHRRYDPAGAEAWDAVGLVCGDPASPVLRVLFAVDPTEAVAAEAIAWGTDVLITHHPLLLRPVSSVAATDPAGRTITRLLGHGCALLAAHTNADVALDGVSDALAAAVGLTDLVPLVPASDGVTGLGRIGVVPAGETLGSFAERVLAGLPTTAHGVRIAGDLHRAVRRVAVCGGSGADALGAAASTRS
jgi:dinuclear metal center YbgI/SA1388 family protein